ncbi:HesA/MoeB/ThiF family protein [Thiotrichales bacterium 19X7-9]|nr:HesA/MoeB/ThiF family protein [Thiotrichales bacterium 19X7-9]
MDYQRYQRHFPVIGINGQQKLEDASVLIIGCGGIGTPVALYLAASGIGKLGLVDFDRIEISNLQRQVLYRENQIGQAKVDTAKDQLSQLNSTIDIQAFDLKLNYSHAIELFKQYDLIIDGSDNFTTRYLINDACCQLEKPFISASILQTQGQVALFNGHNNCYRCLYPNPPPSDQIPNCSDAGVLGVTVGVIGTTAAQLAVNYLIDTSQFGQSSNHLHLYHAKTLHWQKISFQGNPNCPACCLKTYQMIKTNKKPAPIKAINHIIDDAIIVDVREPWELVMEPLNLETIDIPLKTLLTDTSIITSFEHLKQKPIIFICKAGIRSKEACYYFQANGFEAVYNFTGGIDYYNQQHLDHQDAIG